MMMDAIIGISVIAVLLLALVQAVAMQRKASNRLADQRTALSIGTRILTALQTGHPLPTFAAATKVEIKTLTDPAPMTTQTWVEITIHHHDARDMLTGIAPSDHVKGAIKAMEGAR